jgi:predicted RNA-binding protein YlxR (DUF448 family)
MNAKLPDNQSAQERKRPIRSCVACRKTDDKRGLLRIVRLAHSGVVFDSTGKLAGRGAYLCRDQMCFEQARKTRALERALRVKLSDDDYRKLADDLGAVMYGRC